MNSTSIQVLSDRVSKGLLAHLGEEATETSHFIEMFDKFFDALNVTNYTSCIKSLKPFKKPYRGKDDYRLKVNVLVKHTHLFLHFRVLKYRYIESNTYLNNYSG